MIKMIENERRKTQEIEKMMAELSALAANEVTDSVNIAVGRQPDNKEVVYKERLYLAKRRADPIIVHITADANCAYCRRLVSLRWQCCPYCCNGKEL